MKTAVNLARTVFVTLLICTFVSLPLANPSIVSAQTLEEELEELEKEIDAIKKKRGSLQASIRNEQGRIGAYNAEVQKLREEMEDAQLVVAQLELEIKELEVNIQLAQNEIQAKEEEIADNVSKADSIEENAFDLLNYSYMDYRTRRQNKVELSGIGDSNSYFVASQYRQIIQTAAQDKMNDLVQLRSQMERDQGLLEEKMIEVQRSRAIVEQQKKQVAQKQTDLEKQVNSYYNAIFSAQARVAGAQSKASSMSAEEAKKQAAAEALREQIFNNFRPIGNGSYVVAGKQIGRQGQTGYATGPHVHYFVKKNNAVLNPCSVLSPKKFSNVSCGGGNLQWPLHGTFYFTSGFGTRCFGGICKLHSAIDIAHPVWNAPVYASHNGWAYKGKDNYGALYVIVCETKSCTSGLVTGYWHLSQY